LSATACTKIFKIKKRPADNPLIVHVNNISMLTPLVSEIPPEADVLMKHFWPGPLTILFPKSPQVPDVVTCGQPTVAVRMPSHPIARKLIELSGLPIAAPSANLSGRTSPTQADHVYNDLQGRCQCIIDGGPTQVGLESTVVDVSRKMILRPGGITMEQLSKYIPNIVPYSTSHDAGLLAEKPPTPGLKYRHYSPTAKVILLEGNSPEKMKQYIVQVWKEFKDKNQKLGVIHTHSNEFSFSEELFRSENCAIIALGSLQNPKAIAQGLFAALRELDNAGVQMIIMEGIPEHDEGMAVMNRIRKAASEIIQL